VIQKIKNALNKRKVKVFLIFLLCSGLAWFISQLSDTYTSSATFDLNFTNAPKDFLLSDASMDQVDVRLRAVGFQFLGFNVKNKKVNIDLAQLQKSDSRFFISADVYRKQIEKQLPSSMTLLEMDDSSIYFDYTELKSKSVTIKPRIKLNLAQNFLLDGALEVEPDTITIKGPANEIDTIEMVKTLLLDLSDLTADFSKEVAIEKPAELSNTSFSKTKVVLKGRVAKFSEKILKVPVNVINLPKVTRVRTFPEYVSLLVKGKIEVLKNLEISDFQIIADYGAVTDQTSNVMPIKIGKKPQDIYSVSLNETQVEFILNRE